MIFFVEGRRKIDHNLNADIDEWKKIISEVFYCLEHYARWYGNIGSGNLNDMRKAYDALQQSAHRLIACANTLNYPIDRSRVEEAKALLLGISNTLIDGNILIMQRNHGYVLEPEESGARRIQSKENRENADRIKRLLQCAKKNITNVELTEEGRGGRRGTLLPSDFIADIRFPSVITVTGKWALVHYDLFAISRVLPTVPKSRCP